MPNSIFFPRRGGDSKLKVSQTQGRRRTKMTHFLNMVFKHGKKWVDKNGAKCNMGFGRITKNTPTADRPVRICAGVGAVVSFSARVDARTGARVARKDIPGSADRWPSLQQILHWVFHHTARARREILLL